MHDKCTIFLRHSKLNDTKNKKEEDQLPPFSIMRQEYHCRFMSFSISSNSLPILSI